jgi:hypothetical protein
MSFRKNNTNTICWIPDEEGNKLQIPKELYPNIRKLIREHQIQNEKIVFGPIKKGQGVNFFRTYHTK